MLEATTGTTIDTTVGVGLHPVDLGLAVWQTHYITGLCALNLADTASGEHGGIADWHETAALWTHRADERGDHSDTNLVVPWRALGRAGLEDGRKALGGRDTLVRTAPNQSGTGRWPTG